MRTMQALRNKNEHFDKRNERHAARTTIGNRAHKRIPRHYRKNADMLRESAGTRERSAAETPPYTPASTDILSLPERYHAAENANNGNTARRQNAFGQNGYGKLRDK